MNFHCLSIAQHTNVVKVTNLQKKKSDKLNILCTVELRYNKLCNEVPTNYIEYQ